MREGGDDRARRELAELRRRAYGRDADIDVDPAALERLAALEKQEHPPRGSPEPASVAGEPTRVAGAPPAARPGLRRAPPWQLALLIGCAVVAGALGVAAGTVALAPTRPSAADAAALRAAVARVTAYTEDRTARVLMRLPVDGLFGRYVQLPDFEPLPQFPTDSALTWVQPIGRYHGTAVWLAQTQADESCLLVLAGRRHAACAAPALFEEATLLVLVPFAELAAGTRPVGMVETQSLGFWWRPDRPLEIMLGPTPRAD